MTQAIDFIHPIDRDRLEANQPDASLSRRLDDLAMEIRQAPSAEAVFDLLVAHLRDLIPFDRLGFATLDADGLVVTERLLYSNRPTMWGSHAQAPLLGSSLEALIHEGAIRIINDLMLYQQLRPSSESTKRLIQEGMRSSLTVPLYDEERPLGFLFFTSAQPNTYHEAQVADIVRLVPILSHALAHR